MCTLPQLREEFQTFLAKPSNYLMGGMLPVLEIEAGCGANLGVDLDLNDIPPTPKPRLEIECHKPKIRMRNRKSEEYTGATFKTKQADSSRNGRGRLDW